ncbi:(2Fe-2S)-binding protein [Candidatus Neomarinimicrobiota bacterium]
MTISFTLNGDQRSLSVAPNEILLEVLRYRLGIKSAKCGCDQGDCGTCTVLIDGRTVRSCLVMAVEIDGSTVTTLEGLMKNGLTPLQKTFLEHNSFQCGYCTPGVILSVTELLGKNPQPDREIIKAALAGNLCRCTGYLPIIDAVVDLVGTSNMQQSE